MPCDLSVFEGLSRAKRLSGFDVLIRVLRAVEALNRVLAQGTLLSAHAGHLLNEPNHGLTAIGVEATVVARVDFRHVQSLVISLRVGRQGRLGIVTEVRHKSLTVVELELHGLIVDGRPLALVGLTGRALFVGAELRGGLVVVTEVDLDSV